MYQHLSVYKKSMYVFYKAMTKYGCENFQWDCIYQSKDDHHTKNVMEEHFINEYRSYVGFKDCNGYNMTTGGDGTRGHRHTDQQKENKKAFYLENYGVEHNSKIPEVVNKRIQTQLERYGVTHHSKTNDHRESITQLNYERGSRPVVLEAKKIAKETGTKMPTGINFRSDDFLQEFINSIKRSI
jgi:hypothetical protein